MALPTRLFSLMNSSMILVQTALEDALDLGFHSAG